MHAARVRALARRAVRLAQTRPWRYRYEVVAVLAIGHLLVLAAAGWAVAGAMALGLLLHDHAPALGLPLWIVWIPLAVVLGVLLRVMLPPRPEAPGVRLAREDAPLLFDRIADIAARVRAPMPDTVHLTAQLNAEVAEEPRVGLLPWYRRRLSVGLPLLEALAPDEIEAVLAHELAHLAPSTHPLASRVYRARRLWAQLLEDVRTGRSAAILLLPMLVHYVPRLQAWVTPLVRQAELDADRVSAEAVGATVAGRALCRLRLASASARETVWPALQSEVERRASPTPEAYRRFLAGLAAAATDPRAEEHLRLELALAAWDGDSHPSLDTRLAALSCAGAVPGSLERSAAEALLGADRSRWVERTAAQWCAREAEGWRSQHTLRTEQRARLATLDAAEAPLDWDDALARARLLDALDDPRRSEAWRALVERYPDEGPAWFGHGRELLRVGEEPEALAALERACVVDRNATLPVAEALHRYFLGQARTDEAETWRHRWEAAVREALCDLPGAAAAG